MTIMPPSRIFTTFALVLVVLFAEANRIVPPGMHVSMFPEPTFDPNAPECIPNREPCGFYSFSLHGASPLKWVKSWCRCDDKHECVYDRTDMRMRVYRHICLPPNSTD